MASLARFVLAAATLAAVLAARPAHALERWTLMDTGLELSFALVAGEDWLQTRAIDCRHVREGNPILGICPSKTKIDAYFAGGLAAHTLVAILLPRPYRTIWQSVWIGFEVGIVEHNITVGARLRF